MATIPQQPKLSADEVLAAIEALEPLEIEKVSQRLLHLQAQRKAPHLSSREADLLREIYRPKRSGFQERFDELNARRRASTLTPDEYEELLRLVDESEAFTVHRLEALVELSQLHQVSLPALMKQLGLKPPAVG